MLGELRRDAADLGERLRHVDADLDPLLRVDAEVPAERLVGLLQRCRPPSDPRRCRRRPRSGPGSAGSPGSSSRPRTPARARAAPGASARARGRCPARAVASASPPPRAPALALLRGRPEDTGAPDRPGSVRSACSTTACPAAELARPRVGERQARPVVALGRGVHGLPVILDRLGGPARLVRVTAQPRVAAPQRSPDVVPPAPRCQRHGTARTPPRPGPAGRARRLPAQRGRPRSSPLGAVHGLGGAGQARLRPGVARDAGGRRGLPSAGPRRPLGLPPAHQRRAGHDEHERRGERGVQPYARLAPSRRTGAGALDGRRRGQVPRAARARRRRRAPGWRAPAGRAGTSGTVRCRREGWPSRIGRTLGRAAGPARARAPGGTAAGRTRPAARSRRAP